MLLAHASVSLLFQVVLRASVHSCAFIRLMQTTWLLHPWHHLVMMSPSPAETLHAQNYPFLPLCKAFKTQPPLCVHFRAKMQSLPSSYTSTCFPGYSQSIHFSSRLWEMTEVWGGCKLWKADLFSTPKYINSPQVSRASADSQNHKLLIQQIILYDQSQNKSGAMWKHCIWSTPCKNLLLGFW